MKEAKLEETVERTEVRTLTDLVKYIGNVLGWSPPFEATDPPWKIRSIEAGKIRRAIEAQDRPKRYTIENLVVTVDWCLQHRKAITSPVGVVYFLEEALRDHRKTEQDAGVLAEAAARVLAEVQSEATAEGRAYWERRLARAKGPVLQEAIDEWDAREGRVG